MRRIFFFASHGSRIPLARTKNENKGGEGVPMFQETRFYLLVFRSSFFRLTRLRRTKPPRKLCFFPFFLFFSFFGYTKRRSRSYYVHGEKNLFYTRRIILTFRRMSYLNAFTFIRDFSSVSSLSLSLSFFSAKHLPDIMIKVPKKGSLSILLRV